MAGKTSKKLQSLRGFHDLLPGQTEHWQALERAGHDLFQRYGFREIRPPMLEPTELFVRSVGEETDIVGKEMFTFPTDPRDPDSELVSLRPEVTAAVCRAFIQHGLDRKGISRLYYIGAAFRREKPQKGRLRQFHQAGVEVFNEPAPEADVEVIAVGVDFVRAAGVESFELRLNSIGDPDSRARYRERLTGWLDARRAELCKDCQTRIDRNPLRVLDCKNESCQKVLCEAPSILDDLSDESTAHFARVREGLDALGVKYTLDPRLVRGLDYYVETTFEIRAAGLGAQSAVLGGGRYDGLVEQLGGLKTPGMGWAAGLERLLIASGAEENSRAPELDIYVVTMGDAARARALSLVQQLRGLGLRASWDTGAHGLGGQMKRANRTGARFTAVIGDDELDRGLATIKQMDSGEQSEAPIEAAKLAEWIAKRTGDER